METGTGNAGGTEPMTAECALCDEKSSRGAVLDRRDAKEEPRGILWICPGCVEAHNGIEAEIAFAIREKRATA